MANPHDKDPTDGLDDAALFRLAIGEVVPMPETPTPPASPRPKPAARMADQDERAAQSEFRQAMQDGQWLLAGDVLSHRRDDVSPRLLQRLKRGQFSVQDELDLHGATSQQAESMLRQFLAEAHAHDHGCVRIVHGKGRSSDGEMAILKNLVDRLLRRRADVLAFHSAPAAQGGTGAVVVLLGRH